jgi:hypothetical protein
MINLNLSTQVKSTILLSTLLVSGCTSVGQKISNVMGWCPNIPGQELYRGGQVYGDEKGNPILIRLDRQAIVIDSGIRTYMVTEGQTTYAPDDGEINLSTWENMTATGPEVLLSPYSHYSKYGTSAELAYPEHLRACVDRSGTIVLAQETLFPLNINEVDSSLLKVQVKETITQAEHNLNSRKWVGGRERRG